MTKKGMARNQPEEPFHLSCAQSDPRLSMQITLSPVMRDSGLEGLVAASCGTATLRTTSFCVLVHRAPPSRLSALKQLLEPAFETCPLEEQPDSPN